MFAPTVDFDSLALSNRIAPALPLKGSCRTGEFWKGEKNRLAIVELDFGAVQLAMSCIHRVRRVEKTAVNCEFEKAKR